MKQHHLLCLSVALLTAFVLQADAQPPEPDQKVVYKKTPQGDLRLHLFTPEQPVQRPAPAIVFFFGGGWNGGTPAQFYPHCDYLASRGMVALSAEYRIKSKHGTDPFACVADGLSALRYVRAHAGEWGVDPDRIAAGGGSAGGHVAAAVALSRGLDDPADDQAVSARPNALALFNPVYDNGPNGYGHGRVKANWKAISPLHNIREGAPPTIVFLGTKDKLIPVKTAQTYKQKMEEAGSRCDLHLYENQPHGFFNFGRNNNTFYVKTVTAMDEFLASLGWLEGEPTVR